MHIIRSAANVGLLGGTKISNIIYDCTISQQEVNPTFITLYWGTLWSMIYFFIIERYTWGIWNVN